AGLRRTTRPPSFPGRRHADSRRSLPAAAVRPFRRLSRTQGDRRHGAQLRPLGRRDGDAPQRHGDRTDVQAADRRLGGETMTTVQIQGVPPSPFTRAVRLALHEKGVDYELVPTPPGNVPLNPWGKIPLMKHGDFTLYESPAIVRYIDRTFPGPALWP